MKRLTLIATSILLGIGSLAFARITDLTINPDGTVSSDGKVTVSGTTTCTQGHTFSLTARAGQSQPGGKFAFASGSSGPNGCADGSPQDWTVVLSPMPFPLLGMPARDFEPGTARCNVTANDNTDGEAVSHEINCFLSPS